MENYSIIEWLINGDPAIQYQVYRDLLNKNKPELQKKISIEGWGAKLLALQNDNGHWGIAFYQPKWTSTHYTILDLKNLCISPYTKSIQKIIFSVLQKEMNHDYVKKYEMIVNKDICINGMVLNYSSYFNADVNLLKPIVDYLISHQMEDGGFNCQSTRKGATHSSLHTTLSVLEGINEYKRNNYTYKVDELKQIELQSIEFILKHKLYKSDKTDKIINNAFTKLPYPSRWKYNILRCLDHFQYAKVKYDKRMDDAIELLLSKRKKDGCWPIQAKHPGKVFFDMEKAGKPSRWNTLRVLRVLKHFKSI